MVKRHVILVGAPRSGTTVTWKTLRQDERWTCYLEPFHPELRKVFELGGDLFGGFGDEYREIPDLLRAHWSAIQPYEEILGTIQGHRGAYLRALLDSAPHVCIKVVRCSGKIGALKELAPDALVVHLIRDPRAWTTSHLRPKGEWLEGLPDGFFRYEGPFDRWGREELADEIGVDGRAYERLLKVWNVLVGLAQTDDPDHSLSFEQFASNPRSSLRDIYARTELPLPELDLGFLHPPNRPHALADPRWETALADYVHPVLREFVFPFES